MKTWNELAAATAHWSIPNFGTTAGLGCLAPLMGIGEEIGELSAADTPEEIEDAIGDIGIYLANYCALSLVDLDAIVRQYSGPTWQHVSVPYGKLLHARLKRAQKIRGMDDYDTFRKAEAGAIGMLVARMDALGGGSGVFLQSALNTWDNIVSKRKWHNKIVEPITIDTLLKDYSEIALDVNDGAYVHWQYALLEGVV